MKSAMITAVLVAVLAGAGPVLAAPAERGTAAGAEKVCCPPFDPAPWDGKTIVWKDKLFVADTAICFMRIPLNFGRVIGRNIKRIEAAGAMDKRMLILGEDKSAWKSRVLISVAKPVEGATMEKVSGTFLAKVFEGPFKDFAKWMKEMDAYAAGKDRKIVRRLVYYPLCPACAKKYGKNYVVILGGI